MANRDGVYFDARRGYGGQSRTAERLLDTRPFQDVMFIGWVTSLQSSRHGAGALALRRILERFDEAGVKMTGLIVLPDDDVFVPRLMNYYGRFGFEPVQLEEPYGGSAYPIMARWS